MRSRDKKLNWLAVAKTLADAGAGLGAGGPGGAWGQNLQGTISNLAQGIEAEKQAEEEKKKNSGFGSIGGILGGIVGNAILPGAGGAIGGMLGSAGGQAVGGGDVNFGNVVQSGVGGYMGGSGMGKVASTGAGAASAGTQTVATAIPSAPAPAPNVVEGAIQNTLNPAGPQRNLLQDAMTAPPPAPVMSVPPAAAPSPLTPRYTAPMPAQKPVSNIVPSTPTVNEPSLMQRFTGAIGPTLRGNMMVTGMVNGGGYAPTMEQKPQRYRYDEEYGWVGY